jgi:sterol desaturase/sphingolipid hydroxylase (fatty acid hydroxylase superfamily)
MRTYVYFYSRLTLYPPVCNEQRLPYPLELFLNTPSHHRVHHARNYGRGNYGGMLIIWDRMLSTFVPERDHRPCQYGLDSRPVPLGTHNPVWHQVA